MASVQITDGTTHIKVVIDSKNYYFEKGDLSVEVVDTASITLYTEGNLWRVINASEVTTPSNTGANDLADQLAAFFFLNVANATSLYLTDATAATVGTLASGVLRVAGGETIGKNLYVAGSGTTNTGYSQFGNGASDYVRLMWTSNSAGGSPKGYVTVMRTVTGGEKYACISGGIVNNSGTGNTASVMGFAEGTGNGNRAGVIGSVKNTATTAISVNGLFADNANDLDSIFSGLGLTAGWRYGVVGAAVEGTADHSVHCGGYFYAANETTNYAIYTNGLAYFTDGILLAGLPTYADNAAAVAGGLAVNRMYKTATGELRIVV